MALTQIADAGLKTPASDLQDGEKIVIGTGNDLEIYHTSNVNWIDAVNNHATVLRAGTGILYLQGSEIHMGDEGGNEVHIKTIDNGAVELYYDNSKKLETTNTGVTVSGTIVTDAIDMEDNAKIYLGAGDDLQLYHDGTNSYIKDAGVGSIIQASDSWMYWMNAAADETIIKGGANSQVELYYDNVKKFETTSTGATVSGSLYCSGEYLTSVASGNHGLSFGDSRKIGLGNSNDLQIYHDGTNNYIDAVNNHVTIIKSGTSDLLLQGNPVWITDEGNSHTYFKGTSGGVVELYHDGAMKLQTLSNGVRIEGDLKMNYADNFKIQLGAGTDLQIYHDGSHSYIANTTGQVHLRGSSTVHLSDDAGYDHLLATKDGSVELYYDGGKAFETTSNGHMIKRTSGEPTFRIHCDTDSSPLASIELMRGANDTFGADAYTDWKIADAAGGVFTIFQGESGSTTSRITINTSGVLSGDLNDTSDEKKKKNITSIPDGAIAKIKQLRPVNFNWKDPLNTANQSGFIAQEVKTVIPDLVVGEEYDETENNMGYAINTSGVVAHLTKALQELSTEVETLKTKVAALEAA